MSSCKVMTQPGSRKDALIPCVGRHKQIHHTFTLCGGIVNDDSSEVCYSSSDEPHAAYWDFLLFSACLQATGGIIEEVTRPQEAVNNLWHMRMIDILIQTALLIDYSRFRPDYTEPTRLKLNWSQSAEGAGGTGHIRLRRLRRLRPYLSRRGQTADPITRIRAAESN